MEGRAAKEADDNNDKVGGPTEASLDYYYEFADSYGVRVASTIFLGYCNSGTIAD